MLARYRASKYGQRAGPHTLRAVAGRNRDASHAGEEPAREFVREYLTRHLPGWSEESNAVEVDAGDAAKRGVERYLLVAIWEQLCRHDSYRMRDRLLKHVDDLEAELRAADEAHHASIDRWAGLKAAVEATVGGRYGWSGAGLVAWSRHPDRIIRMAGPAPSPLERALEREGEEELRCEEAAARRLDAPRLRRAVHEGEGAPSRAFEAVLRAEAHVDPECWHAVMMIARLRGNDDPGTVMREIDGPPGYPSGPVPGWRFRYELLYVVVEELVLYGFAPTRGAAARDGKGPHESGCSIVAPIVGESEINIEKHYKEFRDRYGFLRDYFIAAAGVVFRAGAPSESWTTVVAADVARWPIEAVLARSRE